MLNRYNKIFTKIRFPYLKNLENSFLYFGGSIIQLLLSLITFPIYSKYLSSSDFGILGYYFSINQFLTPIFILSTTNIYTLKYFRQNEEKNKELLYNIIFYLTISNIITLIISYLVLFVHFKINSVTIPFYPFALISILSIVLEVYKTFTLLNFRIQKKAKQFFILSIIGPVLNVLFSIIFVVFLNQGALGRLTGILIAKVIITIICFNIIRSITSKNLSFTLFFNTIKQASPLIIAGYAYIPIRSLDIILLERLGNLEELGIYSIGNQVASFLGVAYTSIFHAFEPDIYKHAINSDKTKLIKKILFLIIIFSIGIFLFLISSKYVYLLLTNDKYTSAYKYGNIIVFSSFFMSLGLIFNSFILSFEKTKLSAFITYIGGASSVILYFLFIKNYSFNGGAYAKVFVHFLMFLLSIIISFILYKKHLYQNK